MPLVATNDWVIELLLNDPAYEVTKEGRVLKLGKPIDHKSHRGSSYESYRVRYKFEGKTYNLMSHRIVYRRFLGFLDSSKVVNHLDSDPSNNRPSNLELISPSENNFHRYAHGKPVAAHRKITPEIATQIRGFRAAGLTYAEILVITKERWGIRSKSNISYIVNNLTWNKPLILGSRVMND